MQQSSLPPWIWLQQWFGTFGALVLILIAFGVFLSWCLTPLWLWLLHRKALLVEKLLLEIQDRLATFSRHQQVTRLKQDKARKKAGRRR